MSSSEENLREGFKGVSNALGTEFEMDVVQEAEVTVHDVSTTPSESKADVVIIDEVDEKYIDLEIKETINGVANVMMTLEDDLKVGAEARKFEVYATLATAKVNAINSFRDLKLAKKKISLEDRKVEIRSTQNTQKLENNGTIINNHKTELTLEDLKEITKSLKNDK